MSAIPNPIRLPQLDSRIRSVWQRSQFLNLAQGALAELCWAIPLFLIAVAVDWTFELPSTVRFVVLIALVGFSLRQAWRAGWKHLRGFNATQTALELENHCGGLESLLVSAIQLRDTAEGSNSLLESTCRQAEETASGLNPTEAVPYAALRKPTFVLTLFLVLIGISAVSAGPFLAAGFSRIFMPWLEVAYPTYTKLELVEGDLVVKQDARVELNTKLSGIVPNKAKLYLRTGEGRPREIELDVTDEACQYVVTSASRDFAYQMKAGDARSEWHQVQVIPAPRVETVEVALNYPDYLQQAPESIEALNLRVPEGTQVSWQITLDRPISAATFTRDGEEPRQLEVSEDGIQLQFDALAADSRGYSFKWVDKEHGFDFISSRYFLQVAADAPPTVELTSPSENLIAMLGRPLTLQVRARDDHGIASGKVTYRVNRRSEESIDIPSAIQNSEGDQTIDWDYRTAITDLSVGDSVAFIIEVADRYPGPEGPHTVRSETRRITFLSREEYLEQIERKRDRLLSRVRSIYRKERAAHTTVRLLDAESKSFKNSCQLEAVRQEMIRDQLSEIADEMQRLLDDLAANQVADAPAGALLGRIKSSLLNISNTHIADAATLLRAQLGIEAQASGDIAPAARAINNAARQLGSLVLLRDIDSAQEVFAREARMLAETQASLRWRTASGAPGEELAELQEELSGWTKELLDDIQTGMRYDKRPLAVLRLIRSVKDLANSETPKKMQSIATLIREGKVISASPKQVELVRTLLNGEFSIRLSGAYSTLLKTRDQIEFLAVTQMQLRETCTQLANADFAEQRDEITRKQTKLRRQLLTLLLPSVPAPRAQLYDEAPPVSPPVEELLNTADLAMTGALKGIASGDLQATASEQAKAEKSLAELTEIVSRWSVELGLETQGLGTVVAASSERMSRIEEYEARVVGMLERTDIALSEEQPVNSLADSQAILAEDIERFVQNLNKQNHAEPDEDLPPLLAGLGQVTVALDQAVEMLTANKADEAIEKQEQAADALAEAYAMAVAQNERLSKLQDLLMFQRAVGFANRYMADIVAEQRDLLAITEDSETEETLKLLPVFANMQKCMEDVAPLLDLVAARLDVGTPLAFAKTDFEDAMLALQDGDQFDAVDAQDVAAESLGEVQILVEAVQTQTGYVAEIVDYLHTTTAEAATIAYRQKDLMARATEAEQGQLEDLVKSQREMIGSTEAYGVQLLTTTGMPEFTEAAETMLEAEAALESDDLEAAIEAMELSSVVLTENVESLVAIISVLHGLPSIEITNLSEPELVRLVDVLGVASEHKQLFRETAAANLEPLADRQQELAEQCKQLADEGEENPLLSEACKHLEDAAKLFSDGDRKAIRDAQRSADAKLRHFIIEQALILDTSIKIAPSDDAPSDDGEGSDSEAELTAGFISDFVSGETPADKRTEWNVLGDRNRAALNQNFARELPLEYRGLLKNYYERLSK